MVFSGCSTGVVVTTGQVIFIGSSNVFSSCGLAIEAAQGAYVRSSVAVLRCLLIHE